MRGPIARPGIKFLPGIALLAMLVLLTGCPTDDAPAPEDDPDMAPPPEVVDPVPPPAPANVVIVSLSDFQISMPGSASAGSKSFHVANHGDVAHSLAIEGDGVDERFAENLQPGESRTLSVDLEPGTYRVFCPVGDHAERGMETQLTVR